MNFGRSPIDLKKGAPVICPQCDSQIAKVRKYTKKGSNIEYTTFTWNQFPFRLEDNALICKFCFDTTGTIVPWLENGEIQGLQNPEKV